jgi:hypothetical protein
MFFFKFGKQKLTRNKLLLISAVLGLVVSFLSECSGRPEDNYWDAIDTIQRHVWPGSGLNDALLQDKFVVERRVKKDVDQAIAEYTKLVKLHENRYNQVPLIVEMPVNTSECYTEECKSLGGEIRMCAPWAEDCPKSQQSTQLSNRPTRSHLAPALDDAGFDSYPGVTD